MTEPTAASRTVPREVGPRRGEPGGGRPGRGAERAPVGDPEGDRDLPVVRSDGWGRLSSMLFLVAASGAQMGSLIIAALVTSTILGAQARGLMVIGLTTAGIVGLVAGLGTGPQLRATLPDTPSGPRRDLLLSSFAWATLAAMVFGALVTALTCAVLGSVIDAALVDPAFLLAMVVLTWAYVLQGQFPDLWYAIGRFREGSTWTVAAVVAGVAALLASLTVTHDVSTLLLGQGLMMLFVSAAQAVRLRRVGLLLMQRPDFRYLARFIGRGAGIVGLTVGLAITLRLDRYVLGAFAGAGAVGVYAIASSMAQAPRLMPNASSQLVNHDAAVDHRPGRAAKVTALTAGGVLLVGAVILLLGWLLIVPLLGPEFAEAAPLLLILLLAEVAFVPYAIASRTLMGRGRLRAAGALGAMWSVVALAVFAFAISRWGMTGAAIACLMVYAGVSVTYWILMVRSERPVPDSGLQALST